MTDDTERFIAANGTGSPGRQWVSMTVDDLLALITGQRYGHRQEDALA